MFTIHIIELRVTSHYYYIEDSLSQRWQVTIVILWTFWVTRWAIPNEVKYNEFIFELWIILMNCWLLKFFLLYVLWDL